MADYPTNVKLDASTRDQLRALKRGGEHWDSLLRKMIAQYDPDAPESVALEAMDGDDRVAAHRSGQDPAEFIQREYGLDPENFDSGGQLNAAIIEVQAANADARGP